MPNPLQSTPARFQPGVAPEAGATLRARKFVATSGARLRLVAGRVGGEAGLALACVTVDMILHGDTDPVSWPIDDLILLLESGSPCRDRQADRLLESLRQLQADIDDLGLFDDDPAPAQRRAA